MTTALLEQDVALTPKARKMIRHHARALIGNYGFVATDRDDLEQELTIRLLRRLRHHDPRRAQINTFVSRVLDRIVIDIIRHQLTLLDYAYSLDALPDAHTTFVTLDNGQLQVDVETVMAKMPEELREYCELLKHYTPTDVRAMKGIPLKAIRNIVRRIRRCFEDAAIEMHDYR